MAVNLGRTSFTFVDKTLPGSQQHLIGTTKLSKLVLYRILENDLPLTYVLSTLPTRPDVPTDSSWTSLYIVDASSVSHIAHLNADGQGPVGVRPCEWNEPDQNGEVKNVGVETDSCTVDASGRLTVVGSGPNRLKCYKYCWGSVPYSFKQVVLMEEPVPLKPGEFQRTGYILVAYRSTYKKVPVAPLRGAVIIAAPQLPVVQVAQAEQQEQQEQQQQQLAMLLEDVTQEDADVLQEAVAELQSQIAEKDAKLTKLQGEFEAAAETHTYELQQLQMQLAGETYQKDQAKEAAMSAEKRAVETERRLQQEQQQFRSDVNKMYTSSDAMMKEKEKTIDKLRSEKGELIKKLDVALSNVLKVEGQKGSVESELDEYKAKYWNEKRMREEMETEISHLRSVLAMNGVGCVREEDHDALKKQYDEVVIKYDALRMDVKGLKSALAPASEAAFQLFNKAIRLLRTHLFRRTTIDGARFDSVMEDRK